MLRGQHERIYSSLSRFCCNGKKKKKRAQRRRRPDWFHKFLALLTNHSVGGGCVFVHASSAVQALFLFFLPPSSTPPLSLFSHSHSHLFLFRLITVRLLHQFQQDGVGRWDFSTDEINRGRHGGEGGFIFFVCWRERDVVYTAKS